MGGGAFECPAEESLRISPDGAGGGSKNANDGGASVQCATGYEAASCSVGGARFHSIAVRNATEEAVCIFEVSGATIGETEGVTLGFYDASDCGVFESGSSANCHIASSRILTRSGKPVWVDKVGVIHSQAARFPVHDNGKFGFVACNASS